MNQEQVLDKLSKLLAMADGGTEHEAQVAMAKAQELAVKHNIDLALVRRKTGAKAEFELDGLHMHHPTSTISWATALLEKYYFVRIVYIEVKPQQRRAYGGAKTVIAFLGLPDNVAIAKKLAVELERQYLRLWRRYKQETGAPANQRRDYFAGLTMGLDAILAHARQAAVQGRDLIVIDDPDLDAKAKEMFGEIQNARRAKPKASASYTAGLIDSQDVDLHQKVE